MERSKAKARPAPDAGGQIEAGTEHGDLLLRFPSRGYDFGKIMKMHGLHDLTMKIYGSPFEK